MCCDSYFGQLLWKRYFCYHNLHICTRLHWRPLQAAVGALSITGSHPHLISWVRPFHNGCTIVYNTCLKARKLMKQCLDRKIWEIILEHNWICSITCIASEYFRVFKVHEDANMTVFLLEILRNLFVQLFIFSHNDDCPTITGRFFFISTGTKCIPDHFTLMCNILSCYRRCFLVGC